MEQEPTQKQRLFFLWSHNKCSDNGRINTELVVALALKCAVYSFARKSSAVGGSLMVSRRTCKINGDPMVSVKV